MASFDQWELAHEELRMAEGNLLNVGDATKLAFMGALNKQIEHELALLEAMKIGTLVVIPPKKRRKRRTRLASKANQ